MAVLMSLPRRPLESIPAETARVARAAFPKGSLALQLRDEVGVVYQDAAFAALFPTRGQPAAAPWRLMLVTILQFAHNLTDRQAAEAVRSRIDWKYALGLDLTDDVANVA
jgi:transposase